MKFFLDTANIDRDPRGREPRHRSTASRRTRASWPRRGATSTPCCARSSASSTVRSRPRSRRPTATAMLREGHELAPIHPNIVVKVPLTHGRAPGLQGAARRGHPGQRDAVLLAEPGAARGQGRRDVRQPVRRPARRHLARRDGADPARSATIYDNYGFETEILAASHSPPAARRRGRARRRRRGHDARTRW